MSTVPDGRSSLVKEASPIEYYFPPPGIMRYYKEIERMLVQWGQINHLQPVTKYQVTTYNPVERKYDCRQVGYSPTELRIIYLPPGMEYHPNYLKILIAGYFHYDWSNCGVGHIHKIYNQRTKGFGTATLQFLESLFFAGRRNYITATINTTQKTAGAGKWLVKNGYVCIDSFLGGNSQQVCEVYRKDLLAHLRTENLD